MTMPDFVGDSKNELEALRARQIIARGEALVITQNVSTYGQWFCKCLKYWVSRLA
jgi:hypothetical protein